MSKLWGQTQDTYSDTPTLLSLIDKAFSLMELPKNFYLIEFACGSGILLKYIKHKFPEAELLGVDIYDYSSYFFEYKISFLKEDMIKFIEENDQYWDVLLMIDTYRGGMPSEYRNRLHVWIKEHVTYFLTDFYSGDNPYLKSLNLGFFETKQKSAIFNLLLWKAGENYERMGGSSNKG